MKRVNIKCPYCGARAFLRPASVVYGERAAPGSKLYVCGNYPACDSYVAAHRTSQLPMGTLADIVTPLAFIVRGDDFFPGIPPVFRGI